MARKNTPPNATVVGQLEGVRGTLAYGWAIDSSPPGGRCSVDILDHGYVIATGIANRAHSGLQSKNVGDGRYGFAIELPAALLAGGSHVFSARAGEKCIALRGEISVAGSGNEVGAIEGISAGAVFGWVPVSLGDGQIVASIDDIPVARATASIKRADISPVGQTGAAAGFQIDISEFLSASPNGVLSVKDAVTGAHIKGSPIALADRKGWGVIDSRRGVYFQGWAVATDPGVAVAEIEVLVDDLVVVTVSASKYRPDLRPIGVKRLRCGFEAVLPASVLDGQAHRIEVRVKGDCEPLREGQWEAKGKLRYRIERVTEQEIHGWMVNLDAPEQAIPLDVYEGNTLIDTLTADQPRQDVAREILGEQEAVPAGFRISLPKPEEKKDFRRIRLAMRGYRDAVTGHDIEITHRHLVIHEVERLAASSALLRSTAEHYLQTLRAGYGESPLVFREIPAVSGCQHTDVVDVIIPVYKGAKETAECLKSVLDSCDRKTTNIIVINDASPEPVLAAALRQLARSGRFTLLENSSNIGFVATVNRGMRVNPERDVILLNSDTLVPNAEWVGRLRDAAYAEDLTATVTPFSNRATICSLPKNLFDNDMPDGFAVNDLDALCREMNAGIRIEIPTAVGFCMYIKRGAIEQAGYFDEDRWAKGYGEENDFCIRSAALGWRHVLAADVFVQHHGSVSFQAEKDERVRENLAILNHLYPDYGRRIEQHIVHDPASEARARVVLQLLKARGKWSMLQVSHHWGGGVDVHVVDLCRRLSKENINSLVMRPGKAGGIEVSDVDGALVVSYPGDVDMARVAHDLKALGVQHVHYHQTIGLPETVWEIPAFLDAAYDYTLHDYFLVCPRVNFLNADGRFCNQPCLETCEGCLSQTELPEGIARQFHSIGNSVAQWRTFHLSKLAGARRIFSPSLDAGRRLAVYREFKTLYHRPHLEAHYDMVPSLLPVEGELRVAVIGAIGPQKGHELLLRCARLAESRGAPIRFVVVGYTCDDQAYHGLKNVEILGKYDPEELPELLGDLPCHAALFLSNWPETYSYTLSEAWRAGLVPVVTNLGALAERVAASGGGVILPDASSAGQVIAVLEKLRGEGFKVKVAPKRAKARMEKDTQSASIRNYYDFPAEADLRRSVKAASSKRGRV